MLKRVWLLVPTTITMERPLMSSLTPLPPIQLVVKVYLRSLSFFLPTTYAMMLVRCSSHQTKKRCVQKCLTSLSVKLGTQTCLWGLGYMWSWILIQIVYFSCFPLAIHFCFTNAALPLLTIVCVPLQNRDEKIEELEVALQAAKQQQEKKAQDPVETPRRSKRVAAAASSLQQDLLETKAKLEQCQAELTMTAEGESWILSL